MHRFWSELQANVDLQRNYVSQIIAKRKQEVRNGTRQTESHRDLLDIMLDMTDPKTGEKLSEENIMMQLITFLIAGHEVRKREKSFWLSALYVASDIDFGFHSLSRP
jgi:cytochrome P450/NADPH-cytochrome P450 reductase